MATKKFCDCCGAEKSVTPFSYRVHLNYRASKGYPEITSHRDTDCNPVSLRDHTIELCNNCYNAVVLPAVQKLHELHKEFNL